MKRIVVKGKLDKRFFCPFCKADLRKVGVVGLENFIQNGSSWNTLTYTDEGEYDETEYGGTEYGDTDNQEYEEFKCGNCDKTLDFTDPFGNLDVSGSWK